MPQAVDFSFSPPNYECLSHNGVELGIVYTSIGPSNKNINKIKADAMLPWVDIAIVFEETAGHMLGGSTAGHAAAVASLEMARAAGAPIGIGHYFCLDIDPNSLTASQRILAEDHLSGRLPAAEDAQWDAVVRYPDGRTAPVMLTGSQWAAVGGYLDAAKAYLDPRGDFAGLYAGYLGIEKMVGLHVPLGYQTYAWSGGRVSAKAHLYQYRNGQSFCGGLVDYDEIRIRPYMGWKEANEVALDYAETVKAVVDGLNKAAGDNTHEFGVTGDRVKLANEKLDTLVDKVAALLAAWERGITVNVDVAQLAAAITEVLGADLAIKVAEELRRRLAE